VFKAGLDKCRYYQNYAVKIDTIQNQESQWDVWSLREMRGGVGESFHFAIQVIQN
jgi:hypothetical protein